MENNNHKKILLDKLTVILTTHNSRYGFICRCLDIYEKEYGNYNLQIVITDSGPLEKFDVIKEDIISKKYNLRIKFVHFLSKKYYQTLKRDAFGKVRYEYAGRLKEAIKLVNTEYVVLAADDDFYFPEYFTKSLDFLEKHHDYGSVYGHMLKFELDKFTPFGKISNLWISKDNNPPNPWIEDEVVESRLNNLGKNPWAWFSWYAVQRTGLLEITATEAEKCNIDGYLFEKFMSFCHATLYKAKKLDFIYCARQENNVYKDIGREPFSYKRNKLQLNNFIDACFSFLINFNKKIYNEHGKYLVLRIIKKDFDEYKKNDFKEFLRYLKKKFTLIDIIQKKVYTPKINIFHDDRLVLLKDSDPINKQAEYIKDIVENNLTT